MLCNSGGWTELIEKEKESRKTGEGERGKGREGGKVIIHGST